MTGGYGGENVPEPTPDYQPGILWPERGTQGFTPVVHLTRHSADSTLDSGSDHPAEGKEP